MISGLKAGLSLFLALGLLGTGAAAFIIQPRAGAPSSVKPGDTIEIRLNHSDAGASKPDSVVITAPFSSGRLLPLSVLSGLYIYDNYTYETFNGYIRAKLPDTLPDDMYDLSVFYPGEAALSAPRAVQVMRRPRTLTTLIHISDPHVGGTWDSVAAYSMELEYLAPVLRAINIIGPDFTVCTGDNIQENNGPDNVARKWSDFWDGAHGFPGLHSLSMPVVLSTGNHDYYKVFTNLLKAKQWNQSQGFRSFLFRQHGVRLHVFDSEFGADFPDSQAAFLQSQVTRFGAGTVRILAQHDPSRMPIGFANSNRVQLALQGHTHSNAAYNTGTTPTLSCQTGSASHYSYVGAANAGWMRLISFGDSQIVRNTAFQYGNTASQVEWLVLRYADSNSSATTGNSAQLFNNLPVDFHDCKIRFVLKRGNYSIDSGRIEQVIANDTVSVVDVRVGVAARGRTTVNIASVDAAERPGPASLKPLLNVFPNPAQPGTLLCLQSPAADITRIDLFDLSGRNPLALLYEGPGQIQVRMRFNGRAKNGARLPAGLYLIRATTGNSILTRKLLLFR